MDEKYIVVFDFYEASVSDGKVATVVVPASSSDAAVQKAAALLQIERPYQYVGDGRDIDTDGQAFAITVVKANDAEGVIYRSDGC